MANLFNFFGFTIKKQDGDELAKSVVAPISDDGSVVIDAGPGGVLGDSYSLAFDTDGAIKNENDLIRRYRELSKYPAVAEAIEDIVNEAIVIDGKDGPVDLNLEELKVSDSIKNKIRESFELVLNKLNFEDEGYELFERWYIDGKMYLHIILDENTSNGIREVRMVDPRKIKKIKNIKKEKLPTGIEIVKEIDEYYIYNDKGITDTTASGVKLSKDSIVYCHSGLTDGVNGLIQSYLHKAIQPANQLKMLEEAVIIYRYTRAPERRVFYVDVGNLPKGKAEQYVADMMNKFKNKLSYDAVTGELADAKRHTSMMEDFWMPRRDGGRGTEITTLPGGQGLGQLDDLDYFKDKLYHSLNVPVSRMKPDSGFSIGRSDTISRDEIKFGKFITKLRNKFSGVFLDLLRVQLISKKIMSSSDWESVKEKIKITYDKDNFFTELKENEILNTRLQALQLVDPYVGKYFSQAWVQRNVLRLTEEEVEEIEKQKAAEPPPLGPDGMPIGSEQEQPDDQENEEESK